MGKEADSLPCQGEGQIGVVHDAAHPLRGSSPFSGGGWVGVLHL